MRTFTFGAIFVTLLIMFSSFHFDVVQAAEHKIEEIHMHVQIDDDGNAQVTENRHVNFSEGTENFIVFNNLGQSTIENFKVTEDGRPYEHVNNWDIQASQEEKTFKSGMTETADGIELSWGIGEYGRHEYVIEYTITNFIKQLDDAQMLYWTFINSDMSPPPEKVTVEIETSTPMSEEYEQIWGYGYSGDIHFVDGKIIATTDEPLTQHDSVVILTRFYDGRFATNDVINRPFEEILAESKFNANSNSEDLESERNKWDDDDDVERNFGYMLRELLIYIFQFIKSLF